MSTLACVSASEQPAPAVAAADSPVSVLVANAILFTSAVAGTPASWSALSARAGRSVSALVRASAHASV
uniref:Uncharacterized protein n=1 Tax=Phytophthora fragariae TaxID=53985 RepID=A0A6A3DBK1_9STRA|nr:hypothetical protein PF009_g32721 [Phytophthora fragariae]